MIRTNKYTGFIFNDILSTDKKVFITNTQDKEINLTPQFDNEFISPSFQNRRYFLGTSVTHQDITISCIAIRVTMQEWKGIARWLSPTSNGQLRFLYNPNYYFDVKLDREIKGERYALRNKDKMSGDYYNVTFSVTFTTITDYAALGESFITPMGYDNSVEYYDNFYNSVTQETFSERLSILNLNEYGLPSTYSFDGFNFYVFNTGCYDMFYEINLYDKNFKEFKVFVDGQKQYEYKLKEELNGQRINIDSKNGLVLYNGQIIEAVKDVSSKVLDTTNPSFNIGASSIPSGKVETSLAVVQKPRVGEEEYKFFWLEDDFTILREPKFAIVLYAEKDYQKIYNEGLYNTGSYPMESFIFFINEEESWQKIKFEDNYIGIHNSFLEDCEYELKTNSIIHMSICNFSTLNIETEIEISGVGTEVMLPLLEPPLNYEVFSEDNIPIQNRTAAYENTTNGLILTECQNFGDKKAIRMKSQYNGGAGLKNIVQLGKSFVYREFSTSRAVTPETGQNYDVEVIYLPENLERIEFYFFCNAGNIKELYNTDKITYVGKCGIAATGISFLSLMAIKSFDVSALMGCDNLKILVLGPDLQGFPSQHCFNFMHNNCKHIFFYGLQVPYSFSNEMAYVIGLNPDIKIHCLKDAETSYRNASSVLVNEHLQISDTVEDMDLLLDAYKYGTEKENNERVFNGDIITQVRNII